MFCAMPDNLDTDANANENDEKKFHSYLWTTKN